MSNNKKIYSFLNSNGFELLEKDTSAYFGDYYAIFSNNVFQLRFSSSKSIETVDIRNNWPEESWYDLALVKALLHNDANLSLEITIDEYNDFLQTEFNDVATLFSDAHYLRTKKKLNELGSERVKQMFPNIKT